MSAVLDLPKPKISKSGVHYGISWETYESLVKEYWNLPSPRFTFDSGILEVESPNSLKHEEDSRNLASLFEQIATEFEIDFRRSGSTTFRRQTINKGFEPDSCFYIQSLPLIAGKDDLDFEKDPAPDLIIEVNRTSSSLTRMPIFAAFGVKEIWRFNKKQVKFYQLIEGVYLETETSFALPKLSSDTATEYFFTSREMGSVAWAKKIRNWVKNVSI